MKNIHIRNAWSLVLSLVMILTMLPFGSYAEGATETPEQAVTTTLEYYQSVNNKNLASFWDTLAVYGAKEQLRDGTWLLPVLEPGEDSSASEYAAAILNELAKGGRPESWINALAAQQNGDGSFGDGTNNHIFAMIALDGGNGLYDRLAAIEWLAQQQFDNGGFSWGAGVEPDVDITGMALIALGRYLGTGATDAERDLAEPAVAAALDFLKGKQVSSGG
ncbi:MAG: prenyltransferase/squalene oxidase repeat-containing protein, partial [Syntrophomonas sp.]